MGSISLKSTPTLLLILSALSCIAAFTEVVDTDGNPLINNEKYYIIPQSKGINGGLTLAPFNNTLPCPLFVTPDKDETSLGTPVTFYTPTIDTRSPIFIGLALHVVFQETPSICREPPIWNLLPDPNNPTGTEKGYVGTGNNAFIAYFSIEYADGNYYKFNSVMPFGDVTQKFEIGIFENDGFLGIYTGLPFHVQFKKVVSDVLAMKV